MFTVLALTLAIGVQAPAPSIPAGIAPRVMELKQNTNGKITLPVI
jgi:hypothetical protein